MSEIPDDVMKAAVVAFNTAIDMDGYEGSYEVVARAILAERERCAKVAYAYADAHTSDHKMISQIIGRKILFDTVDDGS